MYLKRQLELGKRDGKSNRICKNVVVVQSLYLLCVLLKWLGPRLLSLSWAPREENRPNNLLHLSRRRYSFYQNTKEDSIQRAAREKERKRKEKRSTRGRQGEDCPFKYSKPVPVAIVVVYSSARPSCKFPHSHHNSVVYSLCRLARCKAALVDWSTLKPSLFPVEKENRQGQKGLDK
ncbi:hypothetical protein GX48_03217 [Paracoccidioides brasiliensis]|nr:hypothetical protein GX48_03217 [Paracoccidioides brasiliensis]